MTNKRGRTELMWLAALCLLPVVCSQPLPTVTPTPGSTTAPVVASMSPQPSTRQPTTTIGPTSSPRPSVSSATSPQPTIFSTTPPTGTTVTPASEEKFEEAVLIQRFQIGNEQEMNKTEQLWFCNNMEGYTDVFGGDIRVNTTCRILSQSLQILRRHRQLRQESHSRQLQGLFFNQLEYTMTYSSNLTNVTNYPTLFRGYVNEDLVRLTTDLQNASLDVTSSFLAYNVLETEPPSPTMAPFTRPPDIEEETGAPIPDTTTPTAAPPPQGGTTKGTIIAVSVAVFAFVIVLAALFVFYRWRKRAHRHPKTSGEGPFSSGPSGGSISSTTRNLEVDTGQPYDDLVAKNDGQSETIGIISPTVSLVSTWSLSGDDNNESNHSKKDQIPKEMHADGILSHALAEIIMDDNEWGGSDDSIQIEATALCEATDWLRRNKGGTMEERVAFMQEMLDKMVLSVRRGIVDAECGSRAMHECAAILGLKLASEIPEDTLIVADIPKGVKQEELLSIFAEFGEIEGAAVAANGRGFGIVRFKSITSAKNAISKYSDQTAVL